MKHGLVHEKLLTHLYEKPLMIHREYLSLLLSFLPGSDLSVVPPILAANYNDNKKKAQDFEIINGTALIPISGPIFQHYDWMLARFIKASFYETIEAQFQGALSNPNVKRIVFEIDSPGGVACGCFDLVDEIYNARGKKKIYAIINEQAYSGAYAVASAAETIFMPRTACIGSVGAAFYCRDVSKHDEKKGLKYSLFHAGAHKKDFWIHQPPSPDAVMVAQRTVNEIYDLFVSTVARNRGIIPDEVRKTESALFLAEDALKIGLISNISSFQNALRVIARK